MPGKIPVLLLGASWVWQLQLNSRNVFSSAGMASLEVLGQRVNSKGVGLGCSVVRTRRAQVSTAGL